MREHFPLCRLPLAASKGVTDRVQELMNTITVNRSNNFILPFMGLDLYILSNINTPFLNREQFSR
jgi:superfamily I DNA and RNA helicase